MRIPGYEATTYLPHTYHIPTTYLPHTYHIHTTYLPHTYHIHTTYLACYRNNMCAWDCSDLLHSTHALTYAHTPVRTYLNVYTHTHSCLHSICDCVSGGQCDWWGGPPYHTQAGSWSRVSGSLRELDCGKTHRNQRMGSCLYGSNTGEPALNPTLNPALNPALSSST